MICIDHERRESDRIPLTRPCKVYNPRSQKYATGSTCNLSGGGVMLRLDRALAVEVGDRLYLGLAPKRRHRLIRSDEMIEAVVLRAARLTTGEMGLALQFISGQEDLLTPLPRAA